MKFTEEFPSLKGRKLEMTTAEYIGRLVTEVPFRYKEGCGPTIRLCKEEDVQKHCKDNRRIRDTINKKILYHKDQEKNNRVISPSIANIHSHQIDELKELLKELGVNK